MQLRIVPIALVLLLLVCGQVNGYVLKDSRDLNTIAVEKKEREKEESLTVKREIGCPLGLCLPPLNAWPFYITAFMDSLRQG